MVAGYKAETCSKYLNLVINFELLGANWALFPFIWIHNRMYKPIPPLTFYSVCQVIGFRDVFPLPELFLPKLRAQSTRPRDFTISTIQDGTLLKPHSHFHHSFRSTHLLEHLASNTRLTSTPMLNYKNTEAYIIYHPCFNALKPRAHFTYRQVKDRLKTKNSTYAHRVHLCVERLLPYTALQDWFLWPRRSNWAERRISDVEIAVKKINHWALKG